MSDQMDLFFRRTKTTGEIERDKGIKQVSDHNDKWMENALKTAMAFIRMMETSEFTGEDIRLECQWMSQPKHPNAWGALTNTLVKRKIIEATGEYRTPRDKTSHARRIQVYRAL